MVNKIARFKQNTSGTDWLVGDIHGSYSLLEKSLEKEGFDCETDRLFCTGDLIDRGRESKRALEFLAEPYFNTVLGNHDVFVLADHGGMAQNRDWVNMGGSWWFVQNQTVRQQFIEAFQTIPLVIEIDTQNGKIGIVHGEVPIGYDWPGMISAIESGNDASIITRVLWGRTRLMLRHEERVSGIDMVISGHTPVDKVIKLGNSVFIDTGVVYNNSLTLVRMEELFSNSF